MNDLSNLSAASLPLALTAHRRAQDFQRRHTVPAVQKRVYLNTLATYAGATYLEMRGYDIDWRQSYSHDPAQQTLLDVADVMISGVGRLECRPVLPGASAMTIPAAVSSDRIAYLAIYLDASLRQATLLGFIATRPVPTGDVTSIPLSDLQSPEMLGSFLAQQATEVGPVRLSRWLQQTVETGWQAVADTVAELTAPSPTFAWRNSAAAETGTDKADSMSQPVPQIGQSKSITLGTGATAVTVTLLVGLLPQGPDELEIWVQLSPAAGQTRLPTALRLAILDAADVAVMQAEARDTEAIQLKFVAAIAEQFSVQVVLGDRTYTERFEV
ncbi:MAG: DUF1822 family protein [Cyanobacteria bacterium P01_D01_bin.115]